eukprot:COSAG02_NODE_3560_length_6556_cov_20.015778_4_plen_52_part_00
MALVGRAVIVAEQLGFKSSWEQATRQLGLTNLPRLMEQMQRLHRQVQRVAG